MISPFKLNTGSPILNSGASQVVRKLVLMLSASVSWLKVNESNASPSRIETTFISPKYEIADTVNEGLFLYELTVPYPIRSE